MKKRMITSVIILATIIPLILFSQYIVYPIVISILGTIAIYEMLKVVGVVNNPIVSVPAYLYALTMPMLAYFFGNEHSFVLLLGLAALLFVYLILLMGVSVFSKGKLSFSKISEAFTVATYVIASFSALSLIRYVDPDVGIYELALVFIVSWVSDAFAYIVGSLIGKHKLIPEVSPKKTVEGAIGGVVFGVVGFLLFGFIIDSLVGNIAVNYLFLGVFGFLLSVVSQIGDLVASLIKREYGIKDYGKLLPGHGGIMDRFDSTLSVSTPLLILCIVFPPFTII